MRYAIVHKAMLRSDNGFYEFMCQKPLSGFSQLPIRNSTSLTQASLPSCYILAKERSAKVSVPKIRRTASHLAETGLSSSQRTGRGCGLGVSLSPRLYPVS